MKYMVSCRQSKDYLKTADEIYIHYEDKAALSHMIEEDWVNPAEMNVYIPMNQEINWDYFTKYNDLLTLTFCCESPEAIQIAKNYGYKAYWAYPINSYWELNGALALGVDEIYIDAPLFFDLPTVKRLCGNIEIRINPIKVNNSYTPHFDSIHGTYVRPEDIELYEEYVSHIEFGKQPLERERILIEIYKKNQKWPGNLNLLLEGLNYNIDNRGFDPEFAKRRIICKQVCQYNNTCHFCDLTFTTLSYLDKNRDDLAQEYNIDYTQPIDDQPEVE